jgi:NodT family efflux transporter outer membrane factor (OMF) lipoprotein
VALAAWALIAGGCTSPLQYVRNGFKVGPNYQPAPAAVAAHWIDASDAQVRGASPDLARWWNVFNDPALNRLVDCAFRQNLTLRQAAFRVLEARLQLAIARGELFPQTQYADGGYHRVGQGVGSFAGAGGGGAALASPLFIDQWNFGFNLAWELDFWGRLRRAIIAGQDNLDASVANYDQAVVTMLGDIAQNYVEARTDQERILLLRNSVAVQQGVLNYIDVRLREGFRQTELDHDQAVSNLRQTQAQIPPLEIDLRQASNRLCTLLGIPATDLQYLLGTGPIPTVPPEVAVGIPAELLRRRPDVRQAERLAAAQAEQIGIAEAQLYPIFSITGVINWQAANFKDLFSSNAFNGSIGPQFQWNILNYGRLRNNVLYQDALLKDLIVGYQATVLQASQDVENGIVTFLRSQVQAKLLQESVQAADMAVNIVILQYKTGAVDFNRYATIESALVTQQDLMAQAEGQIAQGLVEVYRAMGGGWEIRCPAPPPAPPNPYEARQELPMPLPTLPVRAPETIPAIPTPSLPPVAPQK